jgi:3-dehydroquinate dehydratase-2
VKILVVNGPNLNFLGIREKAIYGDQNYDYLVKTIKDKALEVGAEVECYQSNHEGAIIDKLQEAYFNGTDAIIINPGAYTHYSYAIHDALKSVENIYKVEIHISDINARESFRANSVTAPACDLQIAGRGLKGYLDAIDAVIASKGYCSRVADP